MILKFVIVCLCGGGGVDKRVLTECLFVDESHRVSHQVMSGGKLWVWPHSETMVTAGKL